MLFRSDVVRFHVRFQVRFEGLDDRKAAKRLTTLKSNLASGIQTVWNQRLSGGALSRRTFELIRSVFGSSSGMNFTSMDLKTSLTNCEQ